METPVNRISRFGSSVQALRVLPWRQTLPNGFPRWTLRPTDGITVIERLMLHCDMTSKHRLSFIKRHFVAARVESRSFYEAAQWGAFRKRKISSTKNRAPAGPGAPVFGRPLLQNHGTR